jgi:hypothetical protein
MNRYSKGIIYLLTIPEDMGDLYNLPRGVLTAIKTYLQWDFPVRIDSDPHVSLFAYDNGTFVVESFRATPSQVNLQVSGAGKKLRDLLTGEALVPTAPRPAAPLRRQVIEPPMSEFPVTIEPHSFRVFQIEGDNR